MYSKKLFLILIIGISLISACHKEIEVDFPDMDEKLVIYSLFCPDSVFSVFIAKTTSFDDSIQMFVDNSTCKLFANNEFLFEFLNQDSGYYIAPNQYKPIPGINYKIEVLHPKLPTITAEDKIPEYCPVISELSIIDSAKMNNEAHYFSELFFNLTDNPEQSNFYEIETLIREDSVVGCIDSSLLSWFYERNTYYAILSTDDYILNNESLNDFYPIQWPFSDELFNNSKHTFSVYYYTPAFIDYSVEYNLFLKTRSVSENYFLYRKKLIQHLFNQIGDFWTGTGNPVNMYTNVNNGYGIFAGYQQVVDSIKNY